MSTYITPKSREDEENIDTLDQEITKLREARDEALQDAINAKSRIDELNNNIEDLNNKLDEAAGSNTELRTQLRDMRDELNRTIKELKKVETIKNEIQDRLNEAQNDLKTAKKTGRLAIQEVIRWKNIVDDFRMRCEKLKEEIEEKNKEIKRLKLEVKRLQEADRRRRERDPLLFVSALVGGLLTGGALFMLYLGTVSVSVGVLVAGIGAAILFIVALIAIFAR